MLLKIHYLSGYKLDLKKSKVISFIHLFIYLTVNYWALNRCQVLCQVLGLQRQISHGPVFKTVFVYQVREKCIFKTTMICDKYNTESIN